MDTPPDQPAPMPRLVLVAIALLATDFVLALVKGAVFRLASGKRMSVIGLLVVAAILFFWIYGLVRRQNWLRWVTIVLAGLGTLWLPWSLAQMQGPLQVAIQVVSYVLIDTAVILLCLRPAAAWFSTGRSPNNALEQARGQQLR